MRRRRRALTAAAVIAAVLLAVVGLSTAVQHDSICDEELGVDGNGETCEAHSHVIMKLAKRDDSAARALAEQHGMKVVGKVFMDSHYFLEHVDLDPQATNQIHNGRSKRSVREKREVVERLRTADGVDWVDEQRPRRRVKRDFVEDEHSSMADQSFQYGGIKHARRKRTVLQLPWPDPLYQQQWYLNRGAVGGFDMNVQEAWKLGYSGKNVSVSILDDGIQRDHVDLLQNYDPLASYDVNNHDDDPMPQDNGDNKHGTRCAGEVSSVAGNNQCGVGAAFDSRIGGVRMLDGPVSDSVEAAALSLNQDHIHIYSASWGPEDDGKTFDGPGPLARQAFYKGIKEGRQGRGNIFVWASGNGGARQDSCSADGYTTSVHTLSISSATFDNRRPWYMEECPSTIATTYSSANMNQPAIVTVDVPSGCTTRHTGTSASAPLAAGIIALALEANPHLTWRDMQHVVLRTANPTALLNNPGWSTNGVGRKISNKFGYGLMDGGALVKLSKTWHTAPEQHICTYEYQLSAPNPRPLTGAFRLNFTLNVAGCPRGTPVLYLEHVQVLATVRYGKRGDLKLTLFSPSGTSSILLPPRPQDFNRNGFHKWPFLSVQTWGEDPRGDWTLMVESVATDKRVGGTFHDWALILYGTQEPAQTGDPIHEGPIPPSLASNIANDATSGRQQHTDSSGADGSTSTQPLTFGDVRSVGNCDPECDSTGCFESQSPSGCFKCRHYTQSRRQQLHPKCVSECSAGFFLDKDDQQSCKPCSPKCRTCSKSEICDTCAGAHYLIDVDHYAHFEHGLCVEQCPEGLAADYTTDPSQPRCVLPKNVCSKGFYNRTAGSAHKQCRPCHAACSTCHGPSPIDCDTCADGYGSKSVGYCRACCKTDEQPVTHHCEECTGLVSDYAIISGGSFRILAFVACGVAVVFFIMCFVCLMYRDRNYERDHASYSRLPIRYEIGNSKGIFKKPALNGVPNGLISSDSDDSDNEQDAVFVKEQLAPITER